MKQLKPDVRRLSDMREVLYDKEWAKTAPDFELYYMRRGAENKDGLRYDITEVPARMLGAEFAKTKGHYHVGSYQELYTVLEGEAIYLMQKPGKNGEIIDAYAVKTKKGQTIIVPPNYGHVTINTSKETPKLAESEPGSRSQSDMGKLKMANWVSENCKSDYSEYVKLGGACYYLTKDGWIKNENYKQVPELRFENPLNSTPENLDFLK